MITKYKHSIQLLLLLLTTTLSAQYIQVDDTYTAQQLVDALVQNSCSQVSNVTVNGGSGNSLSYGYFSAASSDFPFANGIVLSSCYAQSVVGPNDRARDLSEGPESWGGDNDLENALDIVNTFNSTTLEFDFVPLTTSISFDYMLASEEYLAVVDFIEYCDFSDGFAFLLKPAGSAEPYQNLAVIPNTDIPVKVTTVRGGGMCPEANPQYFGSYNDFDNATAFNGQTIVLTAKADVIPGVTYHIKLVIADQGDTLFDSAIFLGGGSFSFSVDLGEDRLLASNNPVCNNQTVPLTAMAGADSYKWYKDDVLQAGTGGNFNVTETGTYKVEATFATCVYSGDVTLEYANPINQSPLTFTQCDDDNDGLTAYYLPQITQELFTDTSTTLLGYYTSITNANTNTDSIPTITPFYNTVARQTIYAKLQNTYGCQVTVPVVLQINAVDNITLQPLQNCETQGSGTGLAEFDLVAATSQILQDFPTGTILNFYSNYNDALAQQFPVLGTYTNTTARGETIYVRFNSTQGCFGIKPLQLIVHSFNGNFNDEEITLCQNTTHPLDAGLGYDAYEWNTTPPVLSRFLTVTEPGNYTVKVTNSFGCQNYKTFNVTTSGPAITAKIDINDFAANLNTVTITVTQGAGTYQYSLDGGIYQDSPVFNGVDAGKHTIYIKDINGCGPNYQKTIYVLDYPRMFSPNGDNINDTWFIPYMYSRPNINVTIFDRYGRIITGFTGTSSGWDGTFNGNPLPATDYWFILQLENGSTIKGHFSLIR